MRVNRVYPSAELGEDFGRLYPGETIDLSYLPSQECAESRIRVVGGRRRRGGRDFIDKSAASRRGSSVLHKT